MIRFLLSAAFAVCFAGLFAQNAIPNLPAILDQHKNDFGLTIDDLAEYAVSSAYTTEHLHITHVYLEQRFQDIPVYTGILNLNLMDEKLVSYGNRWITDIKSKAPSPTPNISASSAVTRAAANLNHIFLNPVDISKE